MLIGKWLRFYNDVSSAIETVISFNGQKGIRTGKNDEHYSHFIHYTGNFQVRFVYVQLF